MALKNSNALKKLAMRYPHEKDKSINNANLTLSGKQVTSTPNPMKTFNTLIFIRASTILDSPLSSLLYKTPHHAPSS